jgi:transcriptional regulator with XRE-family HTH domain
VINDRDDRYLKDFGKHLRKIRLSKGFTQESLGLDANLGKNQIGLIERGEINITLSTLNKIAQTIKIDPKELLNF